MQAITRDQFRERGVPFDSLTFTKHKEEVYADWAIDDSEKNCRALGAAGVRAFLHDAVHNQAVVGIPRVYSMGEFVDIVLAAAEGCVSVGRAA